MCDNACYLHVQRVALMTSLCGNLDVDKKVVCSVTRSGDFLHLWQLFKACGNNYFAQIAHSLDNYCKGVEIVHFTSGIIFGQLL